MRSQASISGRSDTVSPVAVASRPVNEAVTWWVSMGLGHKNSALRIGSLRARRRSAAAAMPVGSSQKARVRQEPS